MADPEPGKETKSTVRMYHSIPLKAKVTFCFHWLCNQL